MSYLNEFESTLFLTHHSVARLCGQCGGWTTWTRPYVVSQVLRMLRNLAYRILGHRTSITVLTNASKRQRWGASVTRLWENEVVLVSNLARGGLSFCSASPYSEGERIEIAIPYTSKTPNIYLPARIVGSRKGKDKGLTEYSAAYLA